MIKEKNIFDFEEIRNTSKRWSYDQVIDYIYKRAREEYLDISIDKDIIKTGGLFNSQNIECLVITNNQHKKDYVKFIVVLSNGGDTIQVFFIGKSKQLFKQARKESNKEFRDQNLRDSNQSLTSRLSVNRVNFVVDSVVNVGLDKNKANAEEEYYGLMSLIFSEI